MYAATTKDEGNAADGPFSTACQDRHPRRVTSFLVYFRERENDEKIPYNNKKRDEYYSFQT
jgi:hypothetical protein